jgi:hypothetical protein
VSGYCAFLPAVLLQRLGVSPRSLAQLVSETFNEMIFIHGDVHCDPHAANMVSPPMSAGQQQAGTLAGDVHTPAD